MFKEFRPAIVMLLVMTVITGIVYPLAITGIAQLIFPERSQGSLIRQGDIVRGSRLIGQSFDDARYFWGRLSATSGAPYDARASSGSNLGPTNPALRAAVEGRIAALRASDGEIQRPIPVDLVTASGSGLDPDISPAAARWQAERVARTRGFDVARVQSLIDAQVEKRTLRLLGEPRVNVLELNLALDQLR